MWTLPTRRPTRPRPGGNLQRFLDRAHGRARGGYLSLTDRSDLLLTEYFRIMDRYGEQALMAHFDRLYLVLQDNLDRHGPEV